MASETRKQLEECFQLRAAIEAEYLRGQLSREEFHCDLDSRYRRTERLRCRLEALPRTVRDFAGFINAVAVPDEDIRLFLQRVLRDPEYFTDLAGLQLPEMIKKIDGCAADCGVDASNIDRLLARARFIGILDSGFRLKEHFQGVISAYLTMPIERAETQASSLFSRIAPLLKGTRTMKYEEIKTVILELDDQDRKRLIAEVLPTVLEAGDSHEAYFAKLKTFLDEAAVRDYEEQHMGSI